VSAVTMVLNISESSADKSRADMMLYGLRWCREHLRNCRAELLTLPGMNTGRLQVIPATNQFINLYEMLLELHRERCDGSLIHIWFTHLC